MKATNPLLEKNQIVIGKYTLGQPLTKTEQKRLWYALAVCAGTIYKKAFKDSQTKRDTTDKVMMLLNVIDAVKKSLLKKDPELLTPQYAYSCVHFKFARSIYEEMALEELRRMYPFSSSRSLAKKWGQFKKIKKELYNQNKDVSIETLTEELKKHYPKLTDRTAKRQAELMILYFCSDKFLHLEYSINADKI